MGRKRPYEDVCWEHLILRDNLALNRTLLSHERTMLAYVRTALTFLVAGISFVQVFKAPLVVIAGWIFIVSGISLFIAAPIRSHQIMKRIHNSPHLWKSPGEPGEPGETGGES